MNEWNGNLWCWSRAGTWSEKKPTRQAGAKPSKPSQATYRMAEPARGRESQLLRSGLKFLNSSDSHRGACAGVACQTAAGPV